MTPDIPSGTEIDSTVESATDQIAALLSGPPDDAPASDPTPPASDDAGDAPEAAAEDAEPEAPTDAEEPDSQSPAPVASIRLDDGTELTVDEVKKGYLRQADYTRKTQAVAEERKAFKAEADAVRAERATYAERLTQLEAVLTEQAPSTEGLDALRQTDPAEYAARLAEVTAHQQRLATVQAERQRAQGKVVEDQAKAYHEYLAAEREKLLDAFPDWRTNTEKATADLAALRATGAEYGFSDQELESVADHRAIRLLHDAMLYRKSLAARTQVQPKIAKAPVLTPGSTGKVVPKPTTDHRRAVQQAKSSGKLEDAAKAIAGIFDAGG